MSIDQYKQGYEYFAKSGEVLSSEQLKQMSPLFRRGYRTAQSDSLKKTNKNFPLTLFDIPRRPQVFVATWSDIMAATKRQRFNKLHAQHMQPLLNLLIKSVEKESNQITRYKDVLRLVDEKFNTILQYGYDIGILNEFDLKQYNYVPKK